MDASPAHRLALPDDGSVHRLRAHAAQQGWPLLAQRPASASHAAVQTWQAAPDQTQLHLVDDAFLGLRYLVATGASAGATVQQLRAAVGGVDLQDTATALRDPATRGAARANALRQLAVLVPPAYDDAVMHLLADGLQDADPAVRAAALQSIAALGWPELLPLVHAVVLADASDALRARATAIAQAFRAANH